MAPSTFATAKAAVAVVALSMCVSPASASWLNQTLLASKINATLAAKGSAGPNPVVSKLQSAIATKAAGVDQIESYLVGNRTIYHNVKNASEAQCLINYTKGRLQYEAEIKQGAAFSTVASLPGGAATADIVCYVDPSLGDVLNVAQGNTGTCLAGGVPVTIPTAGKYVTRIEMAIDKELSFVGRFNFFVSDTLDSKPTVYTCGWAGGEAISMFPKGYVATKFSVGCMPINSLALGRRRLAQVATAKYAINPKLVTVQVASADTVAAAVAAGSTTTVGTAVDATGVVEWPQFCPCPLPPASQGAIDAAVALPPAPVSSPFSNSTNSTGR